MKLVGSGEQHLRHFTYDASGTIASGSAPQLVLPEHSTRSSLFFQNLSASANMYIAFGSARATATLTSGVVTSCSITNAGFGFTRAPMVAFYGGGIAPGQGSFQPNTSYVGGFGPTFPPPQNVAVGTAVLTGSTVGSIAISNGGSGYVKTPQVFLYNDQLDPNGCVDPSASSGTGILLFPGQSYSMENTVTTTDPLAVFCATISAPFTCWYTT